MIDNDLLNANFISKIQGLNTTVGKRAKRMPDPKIETTHLALRNCKKHV